jgi:hypothetical protein
MAKIQYCTCRVNLSGQNCHIVEYTQFNPVTWPEVQVMMALHGEENIMNIMPVSIADVYPTNEKERLVALYGRRVVEAVFPGRAFRMDLMMTGDENLPPYVEGQAPSTKVHENGGDDEDDDDNGIKEPPTGGPVFKPGRHSRPNPAESKLEV